MGALTGLLVVAVIAAVTAAAIIAIRRRPPQPGSTAWSRQVSESMAALARVADADLTAAGHLLDWARPEQDVATGTCLTCGGAVLIRGTETGGATADYGALAGADGGFVRCPVPPGA